MRRGLALVVVAFAIALAAGCGGSNDASPTATGTTSTGTTSTGTTATGTTATGTTATGTTATETIPAGKTSTWKTSTDVAGPAEQAYFSFDRIGVGDVSYVTLTNFTDVPQNIEGLVVCQGSDCVELPATEVAKGARIHVAAADAVGVPGAVVTTDLPRFAPSDGEIAIYASGSAEEPRNLVSYLEWGSTPHDHTQEAIDTHLWRAGSFAPSSENAVRLVRNAGSGLWVFRTS